ncbi:hypothetical protein Sjap_025687 [Stephania japonica]|uniref:EF-hand domain-containing protein n=1 Tax=Stephania japonica TaxID=461633 RepID=A0AAP0HI69_9MAGN
MKRLINIQRASCEAVSSEYLYSVVRRKQERASQKGEPWVGGGRTRKRRVVVPEGEKKIEKAKTKSRATTCGAKENVYFITNLILAVVYDSFKGQLAKQVAQMDFMRKSMLKKAFTLIDENENGFLNKDQCSRLFEELNNYRSLPKISREDFELIFDELDDSGDFKIDLEEFYDLCNTIALRFEKEPSPSWFEYCPSIYHSPLSEKFKNFVRSPTFGYIIAFVLVMNLAAVIIETTFQPIRVGDVAVSMGFTIGIGSSVEDCGLFGICFKCPYGKYITKAPFLGICGSYLLREEQVNFDEVPKFDVGDDDFFENMVVFGDDGLVIEVIPRAMTPHVCKVMRGDGDIGNSSIVKRKVKFATKHFSSLTEDTNNELVEDVLHDLHGDVFVNNCNMAVEVPNIVPQRHVPSSWIYVLEMLLKIYAFGFENYWREGQNRFDFIVTLIIVIGETTTFVSPRGLTFLSNGECGEELDDVEAKSGAEVFRRTQHHSFVGMEWKSILEIVIGNIFGGIVNPGNPKLNGSELYDNDYLLFNFNDYPNGMVTLFNLLTMSNWQIWMQGYKELTGSAWTFVYFISYYIITVLLLLNLVVSFVLEAFFAEMDLETSGESEDENKDAERRGRPRFVGSKRRSQRVDVLLHHMLSSELEQAQVISHAVLYINKEVSKNGRIGSPRAPPSF